MNGQVDGFEALVFFLLVLGAMCLLFAVAQWLTEWGTRKTDRARHDLETYSTVFDRERIGRP